MSSPFSSTIHVVLAADEAFARPLCVTVQSAIQTLSDDYRLAVSVLDGGLTEETQQRLRASWADTRVASVDFMPFSRNSLDHLKISGHVNAMTYARIAHAAVLPHDVSRVIYLDADVLVRSSLHVLWESELQGRTIGACEDVACPAIDAEVAVPNYRSCYEYLVATRPIANYAQIGLSPTASYFNAGVLLIDVPRWREQQVAERTFACLEEHSKFVRWWDQYALNVTLYDDWTPLDVRWNQGAHVFAYPTAKQWPLGSSSFDALSSNPFIAHFSSPVKPWHCESVHPFRDDWLAVLDTTPWRGWRPTPKAYLRRRAFWQTRERVRLWYRRLQHAIPGLRPG